MSDSAHLESTLRTQIDEAKVQRPHVGEETLLYHFTDTNGLIGIARDHMLYATHANFVNDQTEIDFGFSMLKESAKALLAGATDTAAVALLGRYVALSDLHLGNSHYYITCFSEKEDHHGQWMQYGDSGRGYAIGFEKAALVALVDKARVCKIRLVKVEYDRATQEQSMKSLLTVAANVICRPEYSHLLAEERIGATGPLWSEVNLLCASFKDHRFSDECEWRLFLERSRAAEDDLLFRAGRYGLTPYKRLIRNEVGPLSLYPLPIASVRAGPSIDSAAANRSLTLLCRNTGHVSTAVHTSTLSTRLSDRADP